MILNIKLNETDNDIKPNRSQSIFTTLGRDNSNYVVFTPWWYVDQVTEFEKSLINDGIISSIDELRWHRED